MNPVKIGAASMIVMFSLSSWQAEAKGKCKKGWEQVSCEGIEEAAKESICWNTAKKGELSDEMKTSKCQKKKMKKMKKTKKMKKAAPEQSEE